jgi:hypothetical protein
MINVLDLIEPMYPAATIHVSWKFSERLEFSLTDAL